MIKKPFIIIFFLLVALLFSCKKEEVEYNLFLSDNTIQAGQHDSTALFLAFNQPLHIDIQYDSLNLYGEGTLYLDLDLDGVNDLTIHQTTINQANIGLLNGAMPSVFPSLSISSTHAISVAYKTEYYSSATSEDIPAHWIDTINYGTTIDADLNWKNIQNDSMYLWQQNYNLQNFPDLSNGCWFSITEDKYIGIKYNNKYGWIRVNALSNIDPTFISFAIQR